MLRRASGISTYQLLNVTPNKQPMLKCHACYVNTVSKQNPMPKYLMERNSGISIALFQEPIFLLYLFPCVCVCVCVCVTSTNCIYWMTLFSFSSQFEPNLLPHMQLNFSNETLQYLRPHNYLIDWIFYILNFVIALKYLPLAAQLVKNQPAVQETRVRSLGQEDPLEKEMATHFLLSTLAWRIPWREESGRLQSTGSQRVRHDWVSSHLTTLIK